MPDHLQVLLAYRSLCDPLLGMHACMHAYILGYSNMHAGNFKALIYQYHALQAGHEHSQCVIIVHVYNIFSKRQLLI